MGLTLGAFFVAAMLIGIAMDGLSAADPSHLRFWPDVVIATILVASALAIMVLTARVWILYIAGCLLFAIPKCLIIIATGRNLYFPLGPFSRLEAAEITLYSLVSLFLIYRVTKTQKPAVIDRVASTAFATCFVFGLTRQNLAFLGLWQALGLAALGIAWLLASRKHSRRDVHAVHT
ncbi:MAG TPA: hypothetical protein VFO39_00540 [Candidatus Sulfotelmatobacter sp.]|nr:hypothetical protein [Candidatus Sulfotelmatobacter sp.]